LQDLGPSPTFNELSGITPSPTTLSFKSATGGDTSTSLGDNTIISELHYPLSDSDDDMILALDPFDLSLVGDISRSIDDEFCGSESPDTLSFSTPLPSSIVAGTLQPSKLPHGCGLGISGLRRKDGSGPFDGLGIVSIESSPWRHDELYGIDQSNSIQGFNRRRSISFYSSSTYDGSSESEDFDSSLLLGTDDAGLSDVFLQETLLTFTQDPLHQLCHSDVITSTLIPDCDINNNSWSDVELGLGLGDESESESISELLVMNNTPHSLNDDSRPQTILNYRRRRMQKLNANFSSATISSELKRSSTTAFSKSNWRNRSSSWPSNTTKDSAAATRLPRYKWRL
jgi:hypothetical protein